MFPLGHVGITLGVAFAIMRILKKSWNPKLFIIIVGVASLTPDIIDKPVGLLYGYQGGGRLVAHTLVFSLIIMAVSLILWKIWSRKELQISFWPLFFSLGVWMHFLLDFPWEEVQVSLWPAYGLAFPTGEFSWGHLTESPAAIAGEIVGAIILVYLFILLLLGKFSMAEIETQGAS
jgi:hypothetical protein